MSRKSAIVIGAGIVGLATARALAIRDYDVTVIERDSKAVGASIRNFGMIWPIGQPDGEQYEQASLSRRIWLETCKECGIWHDQVGSLHLAYEQDEMAVLQELAAIYQKRSYRFLSPGEVINLSPVVNPANLMGGLYSTEEIIVNPREAISKLPGFLHERFGVKFIWGKAVTKISYPSVRSGSEQFEADEIYICTGADFETLYPEIYSAQPLTKCKLQMLKLEAPQQDLRIGPAICGGLSLLHYHSFRASSSLVELRERIEKEFSEYLDLGIHVMVSQNQAGELIVGDSHEYGPTPDPFTRMEINNLIMDYLANFSTLANNPVIETWNGIYPKLTDGRTNLVLRAEDGVTITNGLGGAGMTLGFGLCEQVIAGKFIAEPTYSFND